MEEMDEALINNWNSRVTPQDEVIHVGDFSFHDADKTARIIERLNGNITLIWGNHDKVIQKNNNLKKMFNHTADVIQLYEDDPTARGGKQALFICHYAHLVWNKSHHGSFMIHGHSHGSLKYPYPMKIMDVGVDPCGYFPVSYQQIKAHMDKVPRPHQNDHHGV